MSREMQDLRQPQDYRDGGGGGASGSWRGGRGGGGRGGGEFRGGRGSYHDQYDAEDKYAHIQQKRQESTAAMRLRTIKSLDISPTMTAPSVLTARDAILTAPRSSTYHTSSFDYQPYEPRGLMHDAFHTREPPLPSVINTSSHAQQQQQQQLDAGDLSVALETALDNCRNGEKEGNTSSGESRFIQSKIGGKFLTRPDQEELVRKSHSSSTSTGK